MKKTAFITGTGQGLGKALSKTFSEKGYFVYALQHKTPIQLFGPGQILYGDLGSAEDIHRIFSEMDHLDVLVNNARFTPTKDKTNPLSEAQWWDINLNISLKSTYLCSVEAFHLMKKQSEGGCIINVSSIRGKIPNEWDRIPYGAAKAGQLSLTRSFAKEGAPYRIRVNSLLPGVVETENLMARITPERHQEVCREILLNRGGSLEEMCHAAMTLVENTYLTGICLNCSGGLLLDY